MNLKKIILVKLIIRYILLIIIIRKIIIKRIKGDLMSVNYLVIVEGVEYARYKQIQKEFYS